MNPGHHFIRTLADLSVDPQVTAHSIIAVLGEGPITGKTDGIDSLIKSPPEDPTKKDE